MEEEVRAAVFGNVGTTVAFRIGAPDAETMEVLFAPEFTKEDLVNLGFAQIYLTLMINGVGSRPFSAVTMAQIEPPKRTYKDEVIAASRATFAGKRGDVEGAIYAELATIPAPEAPPPRIDWKNKKKGGAASQGGGPKPQNNQPPRPREERPAPPPTPDRDSLKAALAEMTEKIQNAHTKKEVEEKTALKQVVATVAPQPQREQKTQAPRPEEKKEKAPFEVPEETLRGVFKEGAS